MLNGMTNATSLTAERRSLEQFTPKNACKNPKGVPGKLKKKEKWRRLTRKDYGKSIAPSVFMRWNLDGLIPAGEAESGHVRALILIPG